MIKFIQSTQFINKDLHMYHIETNTPALARTSNLNEELGQVLWWHYHFSAAKLSTLHVLSLVCSNDFNTWYYSCWIYHVGWNFALRQKSKEHKFGAKERIYLIVLSYKTFCFSMKRLRDFAYFYVQKYLFPILCEIAALYSCQAEMFVLYNLWKEKLVEEVSSLFLY